jgi:hypothetical protein
MKYKKITIEIPEEFEQEILNFVKVKVRGIISRETLRPTEEKISAFEQENQIAQDKLTVNKN